MIIDNAQLYLSAQHRYREERSLTERIDFQAGAAQAAPIDTESSAPSASPSVKVDFSAAGSVLAMHRQQQALDLSPSLDSRSRLNMMILEQMIKVITGRDMVLSTPVDLQAKGMIVNGQPLVLDQPISLPATNRVVEPGWVYQRQERYVEQEKLSFRAAGVVQTADGRRIDIQVALNMSREFVQESQVEIRGGSAVKIDPLVINFDGLGAGLTQTRFEFDLDSDGTAEQIASLRPGNGYLALDRNGDGIINNGSELFGPSTGRGFAELAAYDEDGNGFIDEADSIYHQLRIWMVNDEGSHQLVALGDKNIGAIYLGHVTSPFQLKTAANESLGEVANSGIYLTENGKVGVIQEINLTV